MFPTNHSIGLFVATASLLILTGCIVEPGRNNAGSTGATNNPYYQPQNQVPTGNQYQDPGREYDRGCADANSGSYDRSGNATQAYENGWNACNSQNNNAPSTNNAPTGSNAGEAVAPGNMAAYCRGEASAQFGTKPTYVTTERLIRSSDGGYSINGTADLGNEGIKPFKCTYDKDYRYQGLQSLVNEGNL